MGQVLVRNLGSRVVARLRARARRKARSLEAELREILEGAAAQEERRRAAWRRASALIGRVRKRLEGRPFRDGAGLIREDRRR